MTGNFHVPPMGFGPGSQPLEGDDAELSYMRSPGQMRTFEARIPDLASTEDADQAAAIAFLNQLAEACDAMAKGAEKAPQFATNGLSAGARKILMETLGEGEVVCQVAGATVTEATESVFAGVWRIVGEGGEYIEVSAIPEIVRAKAFEAVQPALGTLAPKGPGVVNAPPLIAELLDKSQSYAPGVEPHIINLTLLPHTPEDLDCLGLALGAGSVSILSRGYGECRIDATGMEHVWKVQYFNSTGVVILDHYEVGDVPTSALAAREDFEDSAGRLREVQEAMQ